MIKKYSDLIGHSILLNFICFLLGLYNILGYSTSGMVKWDYTTFGTKSDVGNNINYTTLGVLNLEFSKKYRMSYNEKVLIVA